MKFLKFWFPVIAYSGIIFYVSSWPNLRAPLGFLWSDKVFHIIEYIPLGFLTSRAVAGTDVDYQKKQVWLISGLFILFYAISDEFHQAFVPGRVAAVSDVIADTLGGILGIQFLFYLLGRNKQNDRNKAF